MNPAGRHLILIDMAGVQPELLERLAKEHAAALVLYARQWCGTPEDVVQEAFLKLVVQKTPPDNPVPWLYRVVRNAALMANRAARRRRYHETIAAAKTPAWFIEYAAGELRTRIEIRVDPLAQLRLLGGSY